MLNSYKKKKSAIITATGIITKEAMFLLLVASPCNLEGQGKAKDAIVSILSQEWPLTMKEIYFAAVRQHALNVSYQAMHKATKQLIQRRIITRNERTYSLNTEWIKQIKGFTENLEKAYERTAEKTKPRTIKELKKQVNLMVEQNSTNTI